MKTFTIGQLAKVAGIGVETIRYYKKRGLIKKLEKLGIGYRQYPEDVAKRIQMIKQCQSLGFKLKEIENFLDLQSQANLDSDQLHSLCDDKIQEIEEKIRSLEEIRKLLILLEMKKKKKKTT